MKQAVAINFNKGINTKTDPWQLPIGEFQSLENSIFTTGGQLKKRNGYELITTIPNSSTVTTFSGNLISIGDSLNLFSEDTNSVINTGFFQPLSLSVLPLERSATSQTTVDSVIARNGLVCTVWLDSNGNSYYKINDSSTSGTIVGTTSLDSITDVGATMPRVFVLGNYFIVTYLATVSATPTLRYISIPFNTPSAPMAPVTISTTVGSLSDAYDGYVALINPDILYLAWNSGGSVSLTFIDSTLNTGSTVIIAATSANLISVTYDYILNNVWFTFYDDTAHTISVTAYNQNLSAVLLAPTIVVSTITLHNGLTSIANNGVITVFYEVSNFYAYDSSLRTDYISKNTCTLAGTPGTPSVVLRSVGLASKATFVSSSGNIYMLATYGSFFQPTYFLIDQNGNVISKLAYSNGGGYILNQIMPQINQSVNSSGHLVLQVGYLFKDFLTSIANPVGPMGADVGTNKTIGATAPPIYSQSGVNIVSFVFDTPAPITETGGILHLGAGFTWMFDGVKPVEHQFHLWPDAVEVTPSNSGGGMSAQVYNYVGVYEWTDGQGNPQQSAPSVPVPITIAAGGPITFTSVFSSGASSIVVSSAANLFIGQTITDTTTGTNIQANTKITSIVGTTIGLSLPTAGNSAGGGDSLQTVDTGSALIDFPTARLTYKTDNKIRLVIYRWSTSVQVFYQVTSISNPLLNDPTIDYVTFTDTLSDASVQGNSILYTTGGTVEDIASPSSSIFTLFDDRLWLVDAEDPNTLWYSKQVLTGTGVEFSDLFTLYIAPSLGAQGSTGPVTALAPMDGNLVIFKKNAIYYINGAGPDNTGANSQYSQPLFISSTVGCTNPNSIVFTDNGLIFQSDKGLWLLGRNLSTTYIGAAVEAFNSFTVTSAIVIPETTYVVFTLNNSMSLMYDYFYNQWGTFENQSAISATLYQDLHTYLDKFGRIVQETPGKYLDISVPVNMAFTTGWINIAALQGYERFYYFYFLGKYLSPHLIKVDVNYNYNDSSYHSEVARPENFSASQPSPYGDQPAPFGSPSNLENWKVHSKVQKCTSFQITLNEVFDPSFGVPAGAGLTLSGINMMTLVKRSSRPIKAANTVG